MRKETEQRVLRFMREKEMLTAGDMVIAGVSGGCDSVVMLRVLLKLQPLLGYSILVFHVNHCIRGAAADADEAFVRGLCEELAVPFKAAAVDVPALAKEKGIGVEEAAREARLGALEKERSAQLLYGAERVRIALAHHRDDLAETVLFRLCRGSSLRGMSGIRPVRESYIRPLLCLSRAEIETYARELGCRYCTDETNLENTYTRNRIRHDILPLLETEVHTGTSAHIAAASEWFSEAEDYFSGLAEKLLPNHCSAVDMDENVEAADQGIMLRRSLLKEEPILQKYIVRLALEKLAGQSDDLKLQHIKDILALLENQAGRKLVLPCHSEALRTYEGVLLSVRKKENPDKRNKPEKITEQVVIPGETDTSFGTIRTSFFDYFGQKYEEKRYTKCFDYDKIKGKLCVRTRQEGDYLILGKGGGHKSLSRYLIDRKIPLQKRDSLPLLAEDHHVLWVIGEGKSAGAAIDSRTGTGVMFVFEEK